MIDVLSQLFESSNFMKISTSTPINNTKSDQNATSITMTAEEEAELMEFMED